MLQHLQALSESCPPIPDIRCKSLHRLHVVSIDVQAALGDNLDHVQVPGEITCQGLDQQSGFLLLDLLDRLRKVPRTAVGKVVAVDARQDDVTQTPAGQRLGRVLRLVRVQRRGLPIRLDAAEPAAASAGIAHQHDGRRSGSLVGPAPALADIGTPGLLAHGVQVQTSEVGLDLGEVAIRSRRRDRRLEPLGQPRDGPPAALRADLGGA